MAWREGTKQSKHDRAVRAAGDIYRQNDKHVITNPGSKKNGTWNNQYIDVIAKENSNGKSAWVIEVETADSISESEANNQWSDYNKAYRENWYLAVPKRAKSEAQTIVNQYNLDTCNVITWVEESNGTFTYYGLPGL